MLWYHTTRLSNLLHHPLDTPPLTTGDVGGPSSDWCIYVTDWTAALMGGYAWAAFLSTLLPHVRWLDAAAWFLHGIAAPLTVMVTILFWA